MSKKGFTLAEVSIAMMIMAFLCLIMIQAFNPKKYQEKTNKAAALKAIEFTNQATAQMLDNEDNFPTASWMIKTGGLNSWEYTSTATTSTDIIGLYEEFLKFEGGVINFCDKSGYCDDDKIKGAKVAGGTYFGIEKFDAITDCPSYRMPYEETDSPAPSEFDPKTATYTTKKCWGKVYLDINGSSGPDELGKDVYVFGMGEFGLER